MSTLKTNTIKNTDDVEMYLAKAWVNFDGSGTVAIRAAGNVSSITDVGTGQYRVNFTNAMADANYASAASARGETTAVLTTTQRFQEPQTTTSCTIVTYAVLTPTYHDAPDVSIIIFR